MYNAYAKEGWNDELLVGAKEGEPEAQIEALLKDAEVDAEDEGPVKKQRVEKPMPRVTEADISGDTRSLNRLLARTLYLVVRSSEGGWGFPSGELIGKESLQRVRRPKSLENMYHAFAKLPTGCRAITCASRGREHEHLDRWPRSDRTSQPEIPTAADGRGIKDRAAGREDFLHESADNGWPGELEG